MCPRRIQHSIPSRQTNALALNPPPAAATQIWNVVIARISPVSTHQVAHRRRERPNCGSSSASIVDGSSSDAGGPSESGSAMTGSVGALDRMESIAARDRTADSGGNSEPAAVGSPGGVVRQETFAGFIEKGSGSMQSPPAADSLRIVPAS
jgi:hypothetical protein